MPDDTPRGDLDLDALVKRLEECFEGNDRDAEIVELQAEVARLKGERDEARLDLECREATLHMAVARLGGLVEGRDTHRGNFLQRVDELRRVEVDLARLAAEKGGQG